MQKFTSYISVDLQKKAKLLHRLTLSIRMQLPGDLANHCWVAGIDNRTLTIVTDDPSRASIIRFQQLEILKLLNSENDKILHILSVKLSSLAARGTPYP